MFGLSFEMSLILIVCLIAACAFEFINGFHDTANAVATVIYTKSLKPSWAVIWSGIWNFIGVYVGGIAVAMGIVNLLSNTVLIDPNVYHAIAMILALIITAIIWNLGTWYFGIPCSSSHTLIGSIFGVGVAFMLIPDSAAVALNWGKVKDVGLSLLVSPLIGFGLAIGCMALFKKYIKKESFYEDDPKKKHPPFGVRVTLIATSTLLSFFHGSNDGQKGVGLVMIILIALIPAKFALDPHRSPINISDRAYQMENVLSRIDTASISIEDKLRCELLTEKLTHIHNSIDKAEHNDSIKGILNFEVRKDIITVSKEVNNLLSVSFEKEPLKISDEDKRTLKKGSSYLKDYIEYSPWWVVLMISISLGLGTMIGWKRIVVTVGEKIGKTPLSYAQGASANLVAAATIGLSTTFGLPVSTTHVLSSGVAGTMVAKKGMKNLRMKTVKHILVAWLVTLPVTIIMSGALFILFRWLMN
jgi:inorganic phosphate transporter, PiT family